MSKTYSAQVNPATISWLQVATLIEDCFLENKLMGVLLSKCKILVTNLLVIKLCINQHRNMHHHNHNVITFIICEKCKWKYGFTFLKFQNFYSIFGLMLSFPCLISSMQLITNTICKKCSEKWLWLPQIPNSKHLLKFKNLNSSQSLAISSLY